MYIYTHADRKEHHSYCNTGLDVCAIIFQSVCVLSCIRLMIRGDLFTEFTVAVRGQPMWSVSRSIAKGEVVTSSSFSLPLSSLSLRGCGCIFFEMACGRPMFPGSNVEEELMLQWKVQHTPPSPPHTHTLTNSHTLASPFLICNSIALSFVCVAANHGKLPIKYDNFAHSFT